MKQKNKQQHEISEPTEEQVIDVFDNPEPWAPIETKLVVGSFALAFVLLVILGFLINKYLLHAI